MDGKGLMSDMGDMGGGIGAMREGGMRDVTTVVIDAVELERGDIDDEEDDEVKEVNGIAKEKGLGQGQGQGTEIDGRK